MLCVFGAGGDRDRGKRPLMGEIATRLADGVLVTSDNPRSEDPEQIIAEIMAGVARRAGRTARRCARWPTARSRSTRRSRARARGDVLVIAGKGHEQGQEFAGGHKLPFDDVDGRAQGAASARASADVRRGTQPRVAEAAGARLLDAPGGPVRDPGPTGVTIDSRAIAPGELFVGLRGERADGGEHAVEALQAGAWGVLVAPSTPRARPSGRARRRVARAPRFWRTPTR